MGEHGVFRMKAQNLSQHYLAMAILLLILLCLPELAAAGIGRFLGPDAWQCSFSAQMSKERRDNTGPGGMANDSKRGFFKGLQSSGINVASPGGNTDSYHLAVEQSVQGKVRLHSTYDGGLDGIQIAGWNNGGAEVRSKSVFEGTEQNRTITRDITTSYSGSAKFEGDEYSPAFQIWIYPEDGTYSLDYALSPVRAQRVEHCRMAEGMEADRKTLESASDADMPLGGLLSGLMKSTCATENRSEVEISGDALSGLVENIALPTSGLVLEGEGPSQYIDSSDVFIRWSCRPE
jgi:hypothetical protein